MEKRIQSERGSAMVEAAIIFPCLVLILYWSAALTDVMVLKLKAAEAVRYALWESTVFKPPAQIDTEVQRKFVDLRSPRDVNISYTGLLMYPLASDMAWSAAVDTTTKRVNIGGNAQIPTGTGIEKYIGMVLGGLSRAVDSEMRRERFNVNGVAMARATLVHARHDEIASPILKGGDLLGLKGGNDLDHPKSMTNFTFQAPLPSQRPMELVFDTWKAWPKPAAYTRDSGHDRSRTDPGVSPMRTYPVVEDRVSSQVNDIAFFGLNRQPWFGKLRGAGRFVARVLGPMAGGSLPDVFSADRMDGGGSNRGPITILPPERADVSWAPGQCEFKGSMQPCPNQRVGDLRISGKGPAYPDDTTTLGTNVDRTRYTLPYRINSNYWTQSGGTNSGDKTGKSALLSKPKASLATSNAYVASYRCRGHYFAGSQRGQETAVSRRYGRGCDR
jgi:hypothetical protein